MKFNLLFREYTFLASTFTPGGEDSMRINFVSEWDFEACFVDQHYRELRRKACEIS